MKRGFSINSEQIIFDYLSIYCETDDKLLRSKPFAHILHRYMEKLAESSLLPTWILDVSDNNIPAACDRIADWLAQSGGLYANY